jgi:hypothetical protein
MDGTVDWSMMDGLGVEVTMFPVLKVITLSEGCDVTKFPGKILKTCQSRYLLFINTELK